MSMLMMLRRIGREDLTVHGFRSTFRDWAAEQTNFPREVAEAALAHVIADRTEAAYRRGDLFEKRGSLMTAWACLLSDGTEHWWRRHSNEKALIPTRADPDFSSLDITRVQAKYALISNSYRYATDLGRDAK